MYILDTNTLSFLMAGERRVCRKVLSHPKTDIFLPQPVIAEIEYGLARLVNSKRKDRLLRRFRLLTSELKRVEWTDEVGRSFGEIKVDLERKGKRIEDFDVAVAAHARALDATLVTDNLRHMSRVAGLRLENWRLAQSD